MIRTTCARTAAALEQWATGGWGIRRIAMGNRRRVRLERVRSSTNTCRGSLVRVDPRRTFDDSSGGVRAWPMTSSPDSTRGCGCSPNSGIVERWTLSEKGERLRRVYSELDLLLTETATAGHLAGLGPAEFAAVVSMFTFEPRSADPVSVRLVGVVAERRELVDEIWQRISAVEDRMRVPNTRPPEPGFAPFAYGWVSGADLEDLFGDDDFAAGDFVRNCRQLLDLMRQIRDAFPALAPVAAAAISETDRGIVAVGGRA